MKKILLFASALAGLFFTSCQKENLEPQAGKTVTFTVEAPAPLQTKAIADGMNVDQLIYEVWITGQNQNVSDLITSGATRLYQATTTNKTVADGKVSFKIALDLVNDQNFTVLFWAQNSANRVYKTEKLTEVTYLDGADMYANNANRDAFYGSAYVIDGATETPTVTLHRPFAQVNLCTVNLKDTQKEGDYTITLSESKMSFTTVPNKFNIATGDASGEMTLAFDYKAVPSGEDQMIKVNGKDYYYAGMNFVFADKLQGNTARLEYDIKTILNNNATVTAEVNNVIDQIPLKQNYRTNIVGNLLTSKVDYEIIVDAEFNKPAEDIEVAMTSVVVNNLQELQSAIDAAELGTTEIDFGADIQGEVTIIQKVGVNLVINGLGKKFDGTFKLGSGPQGSTSPETLTFKNINFVHTTETACDFIWADDAKTIGKRYAHDVTVDNCTFTGNGKGNVVGMRYRQCFDLIVKNSTATGLHSLMWATGCNVLTIDNVKVEQSVNGVHIGTSTNVVFRNIDFAVNAYGIRTDGDSTAGFKAENISINARQPIIVRKMKGNYNVDLVGDNTLTTTAGCQIIFTKGDDAAAYEVPTGVFTLNPEAMEEFIVYPYELRVSTSEELQDAVAQKIPTLYLTAGNFEVDLYVIGARESLTLKGTDGTKLAFKKAQVRASEFKYLTIDNCEILRMSEKSWGHLVFGTGDKADGVYTLSNCTFNGVSSQGIYINEDTSGATYNIVNCTFNGDFGGEGAVTIQNNNGVQHTVNVTDCTFNAIPDTSHKVYVKYAYDGWTLTGVDAADVYWAELQ